MSGIFAFIVDEWRSLTLTVFLTVLVLYPVASYLTYSWVRKREEILGSLTEQSKADYLKLFQKAEQTDGSKSAAVRFQKIYDHWYGRQRYKLPMIALVLAAFADNSVIAHGLLSVGSTDASSMSEAAAAAAGGYAYVTYDLILRQERRDLSAPDVMRGALRLAIALPVGIAFASLNTTGAMFLAFAVGVFPLDTIAVVLRQLVNKYLKLEVGADGAKDQVSSLWGIDKPTADRIQKADITTITQLAWCDPVQLSMRSNLGFSYVLDIVSQALAWVYLGDKLPLLAPLGLRGAVEICDLMVGWRGEAKVEAEAVISQAVFVSAIERAGLLNAFDQIADDPATLFLYRTI